MKICTKCRNNISDNDKFCTNCGNRLGGQSFSDKQFHPKSKAKIYAILGIIIAVIVVIFLVILLLGSNDFVGTWEIVENTYGAQEGETMTFHSDGRLTQSGSTDSATWEVENDKLCIISPEVSAPMCFDYEFSNGGNRLTLTMGNSFGSWRIVLVRI